MVYQRPTPYLPPAISRTLNPYTYQPDTINALWVAADVDNCDNREGATFVDVVDFCFSYVLFVEREKQVRVLEYSKGVNEKPKDSTVASTAQNCRAECTAAEMVPGTLLCVVVWYRCDLCS